ncbi:hypothetical protein AUJ13_01650 [Candidatus Micrarchaeota archaeon CG1_02_49_24]|nr:MAG: hypothetical protein AUJ13_01650 [Candidatus Micrarchaeota archaeon CG1_02_49_24]HII54421.1 ATP-binding protein [Candidatus Micrarchaeota archaeon]
MNEVNTLELKETALRLAKNTEGFGRRYFLSGIEIGKEPRVKVLRGFRGVGKTTALLQLMGPGAIYFSMDNPHVSVSTLYDIGKKFVLEGYKMLFIDEVHHYKRWNEDTKALYDEFPQLSMAVSGSAPLAFAPERRYELIEVEPLSLREFIELGGRTPVPTASGAWMDINLAVGLLAENPWLYESFDAYMDGGAFPIYFTYSGKTLKSVYNSIQKSIREDAVFLPNVDGELVTQMARALVFLASSLLGEFSINNLSKNLSISKNKAYYMISLLESMKILRMVRPYGRGAKLIRGDPKLMFYHPVLRKAICAELGLQADKGALREELAVSCFISRGWNVSTIKGMKRSPDYVITKWAEKLIVEIGGASKSRAQFKGFLEKTLLICDKQLIALALL